MTTAKAEDFGASTNLMLGEAIAASGGIFIERRGRAFEDLEAFEACLERLAAQD